MVRRRRRATRKRSKRTTSSRSTSTRRRARADPETILNSVLDEVVSRLGLDLLGLSREEYAEILRPVVEGIVSQYSSRPSREAVLNRLENAARNIYMLASAYVLEKYEKLTEDQLEFIVANAPQIAAKYVQKLYREALRLGRRDVIPMLRSAWERFGTPTPLACPRCGFRAVTPDLVCIVCNYELSEREAKEMLDFEEKLRELAEFYSPFEIRETIARGYVIIGDVVKPATAERQPTDIVLHLSDSEKKLLSQLLAERRGSQVGA